MTLRPLALMIALLAGLGACSSKSEQSVSLTELFGKPTAIKADATFLAHQSSGAPTYVAGLQSKKNAYTIFVRQTTNSKGEETWISPDRLSLGVKGGMLIATRGLGNDQLAADASQTLDALKAGRTAVTEHFITLLEAGSAAETLAFRCRVTLEKREPLKLSETYTADTDLFYETCRNRQTHFRNLYWVERGSREIVQSRQWVSEKAGSLSLRKVKS